MLIGVQFYQLIFRRPTVDNFKGTTSELWFLFLFSRWSCEILIDRFSRFSTLLKLPSEEICLYCSFMKYTRAVKFGLLSHAFDSLFRIECFDDCNCGKQNVCFWYEVDHACRWTPSIGSSRCTLPSRFFFFCNKLLEKHIYERILMEYAYERWLNREVKTLPVLC